MLKDDNGKTIWDLSEAYKNHNGNNNSNNKKTPTKLPVHWALF